jgi:23S rRNA U2552 (ribose-2'-O)-methylase RlmE/FtsJ
MTNTNVSSITNVVKSFQETVNSVAVSNSQSCSGGVYSNQELKILNANGVVIGDINQDSSQTLNLTCLQANVTQQSFAANMEAALKAKAEAVAKAQGISSLSNVNVSTQTQIAEATTKVTNAVSIQSIQSCVASLAATQGITIDGITNSKVASISQTVTQGVGINCIQKNTAATDALTSIANAISAEAKSTQTAGCDSGILYAIIFAVVAVLLGLVYFFPTLVGSVNPFKGGGSKQVTNYVVAPSAPIG